MVSVVVRGGARPLGPPETGALPSSLFPRQPCPRCPRLALSAVSTVKAFALLPQEAHNCTHTCSRAGLAPVSSGVPGASLCSRVVRDDHPIYPAGTVLYGEAAVACACTCIRSSPAPCCLPPGCPVCAPACAPAPPPAGQWFWYGSTNQDFGCYVGNAQVKWPASWPSSFSFTDFSCACAVPNQPLTWEYSPDCVAGPRATVAGGVPVCRALGRGDTLDQTLLPGYSPGSTGDNGQIICDPPFFYGTRQGPPGSDFGGIELLCRGGAGWAARLRDALRSSRQLAALHAAPEMRSHGGTAANHASSLVLPPVMQPAPEPGAIVHGTSEDVAGLAPAPERHPIHACIHTLQSCVA